MSSIGGKLRRNVMKSSFLFLSNSCEVMPPSTPSNGTLVCTKVCLELPSTVVVDFSISFSSPQHFPIPHLPAGLGSAGLGHLRFLILGLVLGASPSHLYSIVQYRLINLPPTKRNIYIILQAEDMLDASSRPSSFLLLFSPARRFTAFHFCINLYTCKHSSHTSCPTSLSTAPLILNIPPPLFPSSLPLLDISARQLANCCLQQ